MIWFKYLFVVRRNFQKYIDNSMELYELVSYTEFFQYMFSVNAWNYFFYT